ncbi:hypothetical protein PHYSODRAFT_343376 [Phytophthora sojae]|uniref:Uncharacterized protein n=1 Tax=Phytophthora sojae (strain P6497) TaxID=1094619 RepID=G5AJH5_PHYSP|nr:hypothetical protein PHYSODRAFT_343376 [Phytophthora sojae]EGZ04327.1 hypothetical protein PHYSODRAFT_343376 [Phytophthora sojae]|eukprot:XP_009540226.1 hypothetical protein PHYSODRAFT_343376 [Phytophthora sojae]
MTVESTLPKHRPSTRKQASLAAVRAALRGRPVAAQWTTNDKETKYNPLAFLENQGFATQQDFRAWRTKNGYKTLRDFMDHGKYTVTKGADFSCGWTDPKGTPQPIPDGDAMRSTGYTHDGPCEVWIDNTRVLQGDNCHEKIADKGYTIDYSACKGTCTLRWYWRRCTRLASR